MPVASPRRTDLTGSRFGRLTAIEPAHKIGKVLFWLCACECGARLTVRSGGLTSGNTKSCGCFRRERTGELAAARIKHGRYRTIENVIWMGMVQRCTNPNANDYARYGGRGITICQRWRESFEAFYADMGPRPEGMSVDRIDNDGPYEPTNCRWADRRTQALNRSQRARDAATGRYMSDMEG